ncbi:MAG TPA: glycoside hydrolase family 3 C-terminal domain-containing protein [Candidatus Acidoferrum sp.]|nr:glycoside hydrolase family 3 C-terminal domain-containing protein [Candidatus Acidoferrum sp.]
MKTNDRGELRLPASVAHLLWPSGFAWLRVIALAGVAITLVALGGSALAQHRMHGQPEREDRNHPWMNASLSPDDRAEMVLKEMTLDEKIRLLHGMGMPGWPREVQDPQPELGNGGAGFVLGVPRLGIPMIQMSDAAYGVRSSAENGRYSTALPANVGAAASWDPEAACQYGALIGRELRAQGFNMTLGGGVNLTREPRNGRTFEYLGEDPVLAGTMVGNLMKCEQAQHVIGDIKHYAVNDQESGRNEVDAVIGKRAMQESDLLAFEIGVSIAEPGAVMCSYNAVNGDFACENKYLLTDVLKHDWGFKGFVVSDWGGTHSTVKASAAGLDNEEPLDEFFGAKLKEAVQAGKVPQSELDDHVRRVLRAEFACGLIDHPTQKSVIDVQGDVAIAREIEEQSAVLLKNSAALLPLHAAAVKSIAVIGPHANEGMISGGGSAQVDAPGRPSAGWMAQVWFPPSPVKALQERFPRATVEFDSGANSASAVELARKSDVAIVFAYQWMSEGMDLPNFSLPVQQDGLIEAVAAANPKTIVVLETGTAATMPWLDKVGAVLEAWYSGSDGADAVANLLSGNANPTAKLPMTFPRTEADLPHPQVVKPGPGQRGEAAVMRTGEAKPTFSVTYDEGLKVGYKWYDAEQKPVLFPFGYGLSYTTFSYAALKVTPGPETTVRFTVKNTGTRDGAEIAEVYAALPENAGEPPKRLVGWSKVRLKAGESKEVGVTVSEKYLSVYDEASGWKLVPGSYTFMVGGSSAELPLREKVTLK